MKNRYRAVMGRSGEDAVAEALAAAGWNIRARNWRTRDGEIDIIAVEGETLVFVEVKTWPCGWFEDLEYVINAEKRRRMVRLAERFLAEHPEFADGEVRFDVVFTGGRPEGNAPRKDGGKNMVHVRDAFAAS